MNQSLKRVKEAEALHTRRGQAMVRVNLFAATALPSLAAHSSPLSQAKNRGLTTVESLAASAKKRGSAFEAEVAKKVCVWFW